MATEAKVKYNYGETPENMIRGRIAATADTMGPRDAAWCWIGVGADDLLTVLDALKVSSKRGDYPSYIKPEYKLRISILAALGIEES